MDSKKAEKKRRKKLRKKYKRNYKAFSFIAVPFVVASAYFFGKTVMDIYEAAVVVGACGLIGLFVDYKRYTFTYKLPNWFGYLSSFVWSSFFLGSIVFSLFLGSNYYLADNRPITREYDIIEKHSVRGPKYHRDERKPVFTVNYKGRKEEFTFDHEYLRMMDSYRSVTVKSTQGFWGYDIILGGRLNQ